jgi:hypothetical protein
MHADVVIQGGEFTVEYVDTVPAFGSPSNPLFSSIPTVGFSMKRLQKGHVALKWYDISL